MAEENKQPMADQAADQNPGAVPATDQGAQPTDQGQQAAPDAGGKTFSQEDVNNIVAREVRSEEHTSELQSRPHLVCRLLLEKKKNDTFWRFYVSRQSLA